ncbi:uncharacterized protein LOC132617834 [Lycium barbarum]|uniref:uncharacterized protein LOC132617834 n=1 Tax=Lycium barbarum TaxID=112863 RepID=UPI00293E6AAC|nr:uncharacterized protein LOC132617834 [Lycium barbarum]
MGYEVFDNVKYEKARATECFNRFRKMMKMLQFIQVVGAFMLISWFWTRLPATIKLSVYLFNPHVVFLIGNAIIVVILLLCRQTKANSNSGTPYINHENVRSGDENKQIIFPESNNVNEETATKKIHILERTQQQQQPSTVITQVGPEKAKIYTNLTLPLCGRETVSDRSSAQKILQRTQQQRQPSVVLQMGFKEDKMYANFTVPLCGGESVSDRRSAQKKLQRTQSVKLKRETDVNPQTQLRRTKTDMTTAVDTLSNEEFRVTIEAFIKKNQIFFEKQRLAETEQSKYVN